MFIVQTEMRPNEMQNSLYDLMRTGVTSVRVCCAYISKSGSQILLDGISQSSPNRNHEHIKKTIVTSLDFGLTDPDALELWSSVPNCEVKVIGVLLLEKPNLVPRTAFHPKFYVFNKPNGTVSSLVGSANLTSRGLTINSEVAWCEWDQAYAEPINAAWDAITQPAVPLTTEIIDRYRASRKRFARENTIIELDHVPEAAVGQINSYRPFSDVDDLASSNYSQMWIQSRRMQGGAQTQLELPRGTHRFFGATYQGYDFDRVDHIAEPVLVSGSMRWENRPLTWHGDNKMERINLPSRTMGGFNYDNSLILFRRLAPNTFELRVFPWISDTAQAYVEASRLAGLLFRVGLTSNRIAGFLP